MDILQVNLDGLKKDHWSEQEYANAQLITDFVQHLMNDHDFGYVREKFGDHPYRQHNRNIPDGMDGLVSFVKSFAKRFNEYTYDVKRIMVDGDTVIFHSHATIRKKDRGNDEKGLNIVDMWTVKDGKINDHWDSLQALDMSMRIYALFVGGSIKNSNGVF